MLNLEKIEFTVAQDTFRPDCVRHLGKLQIFSSVLAEDGAQIPKDYLKKTISKDLWTMAYGELQRPLAELMLFAKRNSTPNDREAILKLCDELNGLLNPKL